MTAELALLAALTAAARHLCSRGSLDVVLSVTTVDRNRFQGALADLAP
jgi:hypothetical protein